MRAGEIATPRPDEPFSPYLSVLLLYEDEETGLRANRSLALVQREMRDDCLRVRLWRRDLIQTAWLREQAAKEAASCDVVIISLHGAGELSLEVRDWVSAWLELKADRPCALGVLLDLSDSTELSSSPTAAYLSKVAEAAGIDLLWGFYGAAWTGFKPSTSRTLRPTIPLINEAESRSWNSHWGINE